MPGSSDDDQMISWFGMETATTHLHINNGQPRIKAMGIRSEVGFPDFWTNKCKTIRVETYVLGFNMTVEEASSGG